MKTNTKITLVVLFLIALIAFVPLFWLKGASFGGSDDAGSQMVEEVVGQKYEPWFNPVLEKIIGRELPGEVESLLFCIQTGIGVGIIAYSFGYLVARKKYSAAQGLQALQNSQNSQGLQAPQAFLNDKNKAP